MILSGPGTDSQDVDTGDKITYTITYYNWTGETADVTITDKVPAGTTFDSCSNDCVVNGDSVSWNIRNAESHTSGKVTLTVEVDISADKISNTARVTIGSNSVDLSYKVQNAVKTYNVNHAFTVSEDTKTKYSLTTLPLSVTDLIPADQTGKKNTEKVTPTAIDTADLTIKVPAGEWKFDSWDADEKTVNKANVTFTGAWSYTPKEKVPPTKTVTSGKTVDVGDTITYSIGYTNWQNIPAAVVIEDTIPAGTQFVSADENGKQSSDGKTITWTLNNVPANGTGTVSLTVKVLSSVTTPVKNTAKVKIGDQDPVTVETDDDNAVKINTYKVSYQFQSGTSGMDLPDVLNQRAEDAIGSSKPVYNGTVVTPDPSIDTKVYNVTEGVWSFSPGWNKRNYTINQGDVTFTGTWTYKPNSITIPTKSISSRSPAGKNGAAVNTGDQITYEISYKNWTNDTVTVVISDVVPASMSFVSASDGGQLSSDGKTVIWTLTGKTKLYANKVTVTYKVDLDKVINGNLTSVSNTASVVIDPDPETSGDEYTYTTNTVENGIKTYSVDRSFVSGTPGKALPDEIRKWLESQKITGKYTGETVELGQTSDFPKYYDENTVVWDAEAEGADTVTANSKITNQLTGKTQKSGTITWQDGYNTHSSGSETSPVFYRKSAKPDAEPEDITHAVSWDGDSYTYGDLPEYDEDGYPYTYSIHMGPIEGFDIYYDGSTTPWDPDAEGADKVTGTDITLRRTGTTSFSGIKYWVGDLAGVVHSNENEVLLTLSRISAKEGASEAPVSVTAPLTFEWNGSGFTYANLPLYDEETPIQSKKHRSAVIQQLTVRIPVRSGIPGTGRCSTTSASARKRKRHIPAEHFRKRF